MIDILTGDFRTLSQNLSDDSVDLVLTDPPYPKEFLPLWADLGRMAARVLKPSGFLVSYSGHLYLDKVMAMLGQHLTYYMLMINDEGPGAHHRINARAMFQEWKPILVYCKEPLKRLAKWGPNRVVSPAPSKKYHKWGQSLAPVKELVERFSKPGDLVLDPFLGGGTVAIAAYQTGRRCVGFELDPHTAETAKQRLANTQPPLPKVETLQVSFAL